MATHLTPHFTLEEFTRSDAAAKMHPPNDNQPTKEHLENLRQTAEGMELVREVCGAPVVVSSGYRNPTVNHAVGGVPNSDHALGWAIDFNVPGLTLDEIAKRIIASDIEFDQLIKETSRHIIHISFNPRMRNQVLTQAHGPGTPFVAGLA